VKYYKILVKGKSCNGGKCDWFLPRRGPGKWMSPVEGKLEMCSRGYHIVKAEDILDWTKEDCEIFGVEPKGKVTYGDNKGICRSARLIKKLEWDDRIARSFACDCAERVLPIFEKEYPNDKRPRAAIEAARGYLAGVVTETARAAAGAAEAAAGAAAWAAGAAWAAAGAAAWSAAGAAAWSAAGAAEAAAWAATGATEKKWQTKRLLEYLNGKIKV